LRQSTLVFRDPAHYDGQEETKKRRHGGGEYTGDNVERKWGRLRPVLEEWDKAGNLRVYDKEKSGEKK
jgi:hypothetical protein